MREKLRPSEGTEWSSFEALPQTKITVGRCRWWGLHKFGVPIKMISLSRGAVSLPPALDLVPRERRACESIRYFRNCTERRSGPRAGGGW